MEQDIGEVLISETQIKDKVKELAQRLTLDYKNKNLTIIGILNGSLIFLSDLIRLITLPVKIETFRINTYVGNSTFPKQETEVSNKISVDVRDEHVLILDDILDTGRSLSGIIKMIKELNPLSIRTCVLINKTARREAEVVPDYFGFEVGDEFVVGYGLDYDNKYRNLPYIAVLKESCYAKDN
jgi:hypoxanthine phosphoribosyltransferase